MLSVSLHVWCQSVRAWLMLWGAGIYAGMGQAASHTLCNPVLWNRNLWRKLSVHSAKSWKYLTSYTHGLSWFNSLRSRRADETFDGSGLLDPFIDTHPWGYSFHFCIWVFFCMCNHWVSATDSVLITTLFRIQEEPAPKSKANRKTPEVIVWT